MSQYYRDIDQLYEIYGYFLDKVLTDPNGFLDVKEALESKGFKPDLAEVQMRPKTTIKIDEEKSAQQVLKLVELLEEHDDVSDVFANFDIPDHLLEALM